ncbi:MAG: hypothetical protein WBC44_12940 [Planctomycetaceae bacterium]
MKLSASGLKNMNWKQFLVDHGEKLFLGGVALLGLAALGFTRWAPYSEKTPYGLLQDVQTAEQQHKTSVWPEAEQQEYTTQDDIYAKAQQLLSPLDDARFAFGRTLPELYWPVIPQQQPLEEPKWYAVERLVAKTGTVLYAKAPSMDEALAATEVEDPMAAESQDDPESTGPRGLDVGDFAPAARRPQGPPGMGPPGSEMSEGYAPPGDEMESGGARGGRNARRGRGGAARGGARGSSSSGGGSSSSGPAGGHGGAAPALGMDFYGGSEMGMMGGMSGPIEAEAKRFVSVRGVFPVKNQERELARALGAQSAAEVVNALEFADFELERQAAVQGDNAWAGPWEKVDIQVALDVLNEQANFAADVVDQSVTNSVFTMPLPNRIIGGWDERDASHPALSQFELTEDAKKQQLWLQTKIAEYAETQKELESAQRQPGGFAGQTYDTRQVGSMMMMDEGYMNEMASSGMSALGMSSGPMGGAQPRANDKKFTKEDIKNMITASGTYLLFRYLDFDVQPGRAYRYRVRLKVNNPSFGRDAGEAVRQDVVEGEYRFTAWSEPTPPVIVPEDTRHFLVEVEQPSANQADRATFELFQWSQEFGTFVSEFLAVEPGQFVGGPAKADVIDPAAQTFEEQDFTFTSNDVLVDIDRNAMNVASRTELGVTDRKFRIPAQVLTVNDWGGLQVQDPVETAGSRGQWEAFIRQNATDFDYLKEQVAATGESGMEYGEEGDMYSGAMSSGGGRGSGPASPLRRGRGRGGMSSGGSSSSGGMEGMEGMGGGGRPRPRAR